MTVYAAMNIANARRVLDHGLAIGTQVMTLEGAFPVEYLSPGDRVITRTGARKLLAIEMTLVQNARVVRISQGVLGVGRPTDVITVTPDQPILIRDWRAKALTGDATALIPASRLVDGEYIRAEIIAELRLFTLRFDEDVVIYAGDLELACTSAPVAA
ncbi:MAG: hypothetical protein JWS10_2017 [Cypionkella sp.]|uniref:Hint domain-containing protein n=1 Tax=Cypionkella sp. TaxID=2811411 RepID=UPI0026248824|nr:Hint domain-containing protein [Cypionkella sp.]MDB5659402.1 hypothetical protein [Cypionkella sp.]